jgi:phosphate transport system substrate-binding protein
VTSIVVNKTPLTVLTLNGIKPLPRLVASGAYPLSKEISFVIPSTPAPPVLKFIAFIHSPQGRAIAEKAGVLVTAGSTARE